ncbi:helix-turn-helix transcriptional regulator [Cognaticolwellia mytili]|uniref:helix-turn-helix transcriptional regulator n=1 Tax=Cognaticolwellia mytili TaxID=1888913 RepID=UPI000A17839C|nr:helix-turn-helix transcriptional regulator [Cognaticolwellia mytili]
MEDMINNKLLKQLRNQKNWSQEELATVSGLSHRTVQRIESSGNCSLESKRALAVALEIEASKLETQESKWILALQLLKLPQQTQVIVYFLLTTLIISIFVIRNYQKDIEFNFVIEDKHGVYTNTLNIEPPLGSTKVIELHNGYSLEVDYIFGLTPRLKSQLYYTSANGKTLIHSSNRIYTDFPPVKYQINSQGQISFISPFITSNSESSTYKAT